MDSNKILKILKTLNDPVTGQDLISMKRIEDLRITEDTVSFTIGLQQADDQIKMTLYESAVNAINAEYPDARVDIHFKTADASSEGILPHVKNIIAIASGKGGVGKSTVSVNLALGLQKLGAKVGIIDADLYGPSIPTMLDIKEKRPRIKELYGRHRIIPIEQYGLYAISIGNIVDPEQAVVLRGPRLAGIIKQFINEVIWPELDYLIIDLPPGTGDIQLTLVQTVPLTGAIMVTTPQDVAVADAVKAMNMFMLENINVPIIGIVENMSWFIPDDMPEKKYKIFGEGGGKALAQKAKSVLLAQLPLITKVRSSGDGGLPIILQEDHFAAEDYLEMAKKAAQQTAIRNEVLAPTKIVGVN